MTEATRTAGPAAAPVRFAGRATPRVPAGAWFALAVLGYLAVAAGVRALIARSLMIDESELLAQSQTLALGYGSQPPLAAWLAWGTVGVFGPSGVAIVGVRFAILGLMYAGLFACARVLTDTPGRAALAAASALLLPAVCWEFVVDKTHTPLACAMAALTVAALIRAARGGEVRWALAVGVVAGLGVLSKYTFVPFALGVAAAALTVAPYRRWLLSSRGVLAALVAAAVAFPHAAWAVTNHAEVAGGITRSMTDRPDQAVTMMARSAADVFATSCSVVLTVFTLLAPGVLRRQPDSPPPTVLLVRALACGSVAAVAVVAAAGGTRLKPHWFTPMAVLLPVVLVARLDLVFVPRRRLLVLWGAIGLAVAGPVVGGILVGTTDWIEQGRSLRARDQLAIDTAELLHPHNPDTVVCEFMRDAGNVSLARPGAAVAVLGTPADARVPVRGRISLLVWDASTEDAIPKRVLDALASEYGLRIHSSARMRFAGTKWSAENPLGRRLGVIRLLPVPKRD